MSNLTKQFVQNKWNDAENKNFEVDRIWFIKDDNDVYALAPEHLTGLPSWDEIKATGPDLSSIWWKMKERPNEGAMMFGNVGILKKDDEPAIVAPQQPEPQPQPIVVTEQPKSPKTGLLIGLLLLVLFIVAPFLIIGTSKMKRWLFKK